MSGEPVQSSYNQICIKGPGSILSELEHRKGIDTAYVVPIREVKLDEKIRKLNYYGPI